VPALPAARPLTLLCWGLGLVACTVLPVPAQAPPPLEFAGLRPGMTRAAAESVLRARGAPLACQATRQPRIQACSAVLPDSLAGPRTVTLSLVDGRAGIVLVAGPASAETIADWHAGLVDRYGAVAVSRQPGQESFQWVRRNQMLRLTVRRESGGLVASVSLVDGALLDGLPSP